MLRGPRHIKSRDRAITKEDFEWLAHQAAGEIAKARCLPTTRVVAGNLHGESPGLGDCDHRPGRRNGRAPPQRRIDSNR